MTDEQIAYLTRLLHNDGGELDRVLKVACFTVLAAEELRVSVERKAVDFFTGVSKEDCFPEAYKQLGSRKSAERLEAAMLFFSSLDAFNKDDLEVIRRAIEMRNNVAHRLSEMIWAGDPAVFEETAIFAMIATTNKVNRWWIQNFEASIDPETWQSLDEAALSRSEFLSASFTRHLFLTAFPSFSLENEE